MRELFSYYPSVIRKWLTDTPLSWQKESKTVGITQSSLEVMPGDIFVALRGKRDGHDFIPEALSRGASLVIVEKKHPALSALDPLVRSKIIEVPNTLMALGTLAYHHRKRFSPLVIAITGSNGKTTTKEILASIAHVVGFEHTVVTEKNFNNEIGVPFTLFRINDNTKIVILEMGMNHRGEVKRLSRMAAPHLAILTSIGEAHIEFLGSVKNIARSEAEVVSEMPGGYLYLPDNCRKAKVIRKLAKKHHVTLKLVSWQNSKLQVKQTLPSGFNLEIFGRHFYWPLPGKALLSNLALAIELLHDIGFTEQDILTALKNFHPPEKRLNIHQNYFTVIDDSYNANPASARSSIEAALQLAAGKACVAILGDFKELGRHSAKLHRKVGKFCAASELVQVYSFGEEASEITKEFAKRRKTTAAHYPNTSEGLLQLVEDIRHSHAAGTVILVKGSRSMKMERIVEALLQQN